MSPVPNTMKEGGEKPEIEPTKVAPEEKQET